METALKNGTTTTIERAIRLDKLGFARAAKELVDLKEKQKNLAIAYEHYRFVTPEKVDAFNMALRAKTGKNMQSLMQMEYQELAFTPIGDYKAVPPEEVLTKLEEAQSHKCFENFEVAFIRNVKDPLLFGRVRGTSNRFFIAQWDNDVTIDDLLKANEG